MNLELKDMASLVLEKPPCCQLLPVLNLLTGQKSIKKILKPTFHFRLSLKTKIVRKKLQSADFA